MTATSGPAAPSVRRNQNVPLGIGLMALGMFVFSVNDTMGKWLAASYSAPQILLFRSAAALIVLLPIVSHNGGFRELFRVERPRMQLARAVLATVETALFYWAVHYLPLANAMTYYLAGPIYVTLLAAVFLGEPVGWRRWTAIAVGFAGVVVALGPSVTSFGWPVLIAFAGSVAYAVFLVITRSLSETPDWVMAAWQVAISLVFGLILTPMMWVAPANWFDVPLLFLIGVVALAAIVMVNRSLALAPVSVVAPYQYTLLVWAVIFGYLVFGDVPGVQTLIGGAIIIAAGLYIFFREQRIGVELGLEVPPER